MCDKPEEKNGCEAFVPNVFFPQTCTHMTHGYNNKGELRTALITGGDRVVFFKDGVRIAESQRLFKDHRLFCNSDISTQTLLPTSKAQLPQIKHISLCPFSMDAIRLVVVTSDSAWVFEVHDPDATEQDSVLTTLREVGPKVSPNPLPDPSQQTPFHSVCVDAGKRSSSSLDASARALTPCRTAPTGDQTFRVIGRRLKLVESAQKSGSVHPLLDLSKPDDQMAFAASPSKVTALSNQRHSYTPKASFPNLSQQSQENLVTQRTVHTRIVTAAFVTERSICLVYEDEAILIGLRVSPLDSSKETQHTPFSPTAEIEVRILWRSMGAYTALAVCHFTSSVALSLQSSSIVVFVANTNPPDANACCCATSSEVEGLSTKQLSPTVASDSLYSPHKVSSMDEVKPSSLTRDFSVTLLPSQGRSNDCPGATREGPDAPLMLSKHGLTASLGIYRIHCIEWHCVSSHSLICVTCIHPRKGGMCVMLYTIHSLQTVKHFSNILHQDETTSCAGSLSDDERSLGISGRFSARASYQRLELDNIMQLVPMGLISFVFNPTFDSSLASASLTEFTAIADESFSASRCPSRRDSFSNFIRFSTAQSSPSKLIPSIGHMAGDFSLSTASPLVVGHTSLIPSFSCSMKESSCNDVLQFLNVEPDGTVWTSCYKSVQRPYSSFPLQRVQGLSCMRLLAPLFEMYGMLYRMDALPMYKYRPLEMATTASASKLFTSNARRYRFVGYFDTSGVVAVIMVDLLAVIYRVECFLAVGCRPILSLCTLDTVSTACSRFDRAERLVAALLGNTDRSTSGESSLLKTVATDRFQKGVNGKMPCIANGSAREHHQLWGLAIFSQRWTFKGFTSALLTVAPFRMQEDPPPPWVGSTQYKAASSRTSHASTSRFETPSWLNKEELQPRGSAGVIHTVQAENSSKTQMPAFLLMTPATEGRDALSIEQQSLYDTHADTRDVVLLDQHGGHLSPESSNLRARPKQLSSTTSDVTYHKQTRYILRGGCVSHEGEYLYLSAFSSAPHTEAGVAGTLSDPVQASCFPHSRPFRYTTSDFCDFLISLTPLDLESLVPTHPNFRVGGVQVARAAVASLIPIPSSFLHPQGLIGDLSDSTLGDRTQAWSALEHKVGASASTLSHALSYSQQIKSNSREVRCKVVTRDSTTDVVGSALGLKVCVQSPLLPLLWVELPIKHEGESNVAHILDLQGELVMNDTVVGVLIERSPFPSRELLKRKVRLNELSGSGRRWAGYGSDDTELLLYGTHIGQCYGENEDALFDLEGSIAGVCSFSIGSNGEVLVQHRHGISCWLRSFPSSQSCDGSFTERRYHYVEDTQRRVEWDELSQSFFLGSGTCPASGVGSSLLTAPHDWDASAETNTESIVDLLAIVHITKPTRKILEAAERRFWREQSGHLCGLGSKADLICSLSLTDYLRILPTWFTSCTSSFEGSVVQYHPQSIMQLIGMGRWSVLSAVLSAVHKAARSCVAEKDSVRSDLELSSPAFGNLSTACMGGGDGAGPMSFVSTLGFTGNPFVTSTQTVILAREVCCSGKHAAQPDRDNAVPCMPRPVPFGGPWEGDTIQNTILLQTRSQARHFFDTAVDDTEIENLRVLLPKVFLHHLTSKAQLDLVCIVEALAAARRFASSVDEAASHFYFFYKLNELRRRLQLIGSNPTTSNPLAAVTVFQLATDHTAARVVETVSYFWAAMSDSQASILQELLPCLSTDLSCRLSRSLETGAATDTFTPSSSTPITWELLERCGIPYWVKDQMQLRVLADAVARERFRASKNIPDCALMFCISGNLSTLIALCKERKETKLRDFYSRDFTEERNRRAATANAYAALGKNQTSYAASFFLLARDLRSAVQVILQRQQNPCLALFVLRASTLSERTHLGSVKAPTYAENLAWFREAWRAQACGTQIDLWLHACLYWLMGDHEHKVTALQCLAQHPTGHPEVLCILRYARGRVIELTQRGEEFLSAECELICLLRLARYCQVHRLDLNAYLHYADARKLLNDYRTAQSQRASKASTQKANPSIGSQDSWERPRPLPGEPRLQANYDTGTLLFKGFGDEEQEEEVYIENKNARVSSGTDLHTSPVVHEPDEKISQLSKTGILDKISLDTHPGTLSGISKHLLDRIEQEITYASSSILYRNVCAECQLKLKSQNSGGNVGFMSCSIHTTNSTFSITDTRLYCVLVPLLLSVVREGPTSEIDTALSNVLAYVLPLLARVVWSPPAGATSPSLDCSPKHSSELRGCFVQERVHGFVMILIICLTEIAMRSRSQPLACALLRVSCYSMEDLLHHVTFITGQIPFTDANDWSAAELNDKQVPPVEDATAALPRIHPVLAFWCCLFHHLMEFSPSPPGASSVTGLTHKALLVRCRRAEDAAIHFSELSSEDDNASFMSPEYQACCETLFTAASKAKEGGRAREDFAPTAHTDQRFVPHKCDFLDWHFAWVNCCIGAHVLQVLGSASPQAPESFECPGGDFSARAAAEVPADEITSRGVSSSFHTEHHYGFELLLCCASVYMALRFDRLAVECYFRASRSDRGQGGDTTTMAPNGGLVEIRRTLLSGLFVLIALLEAALESDCRKPPPGLTSKSGRSSICISAGDDDPLLRLGSATNLKSRVSASSTFTDRSAHNFLVWTAPPESLVTSLVSFCRAHVKLLLGSPWPDQASTLGALRGELVRAFFSQSAYGDSGGALAGNRSGPDPAGRRAWISANPILCIFDPPLEGGDGYGDQYRRILAERGRLVLRQMESSWQRHYHTHRSYRDLQLAILSKGTVLDHPVAAEHPVLHRSSHSINFLDFDYSSCESLVWATEAGLSVSHGFCEILASDHEDALRTQIAERNVVIAAFSRGFQAQMRLLGRLSVPDAAAVLTPATPAAATLPDRPHAMIAASLSLVSHPHLPFYINSHPDGHLDVYPFACTEYIASYPCPGGSPAITPVSFSTDGWQFTIGLQDGSVVGWRFATVDADKALRFCFPGCFLSSGLKAVFFCGGQTSRVVAVGAVVEPHRRLKSERGFWVRANDVPHGESARGRGAEDGALPYGGRTPTAPCQAPNVSGASLLRVPSSGGRTPLEDSALFVSSVSEGYTGDQSSGAYRGAARRPAPRVTVQVSELLIIDTGLRMGEVVVRCALPFTAAFAAYLEALEVVMVVSLEGLLASYEVALGRLTVLSEVPLAWLGREGGRGPPLGPPAAPETITTLAVSPYDPILALGTTSGFALLLQLRTVAEAIRSRRAGATPREPGQGLDFVYVHPTRAEGGGVERPSDDAVHRVPHDAAGQRSLNRTEGLIGRFEPKFLRVPAMVDFIFRAEFSGTEAVASESEKRTEAKMRTPSTSPQPLLQQARRIQIAPLSGRNDTGVLCLKFAPSVLLAGLKDGTLMAVQLIPESLRRAFLQPGSPRNKQL